MNESLTLMTQKATLGMLHQLLVQVNFVCLDRNLFRNNADGGMPEARKSLE